ncbi:MAG: FAD binding domain-containing protein, partial [Dehalococcoidia bacterium]
RASVGGNICNAAPSADTVPPLLVHGAVAVIAGLSGRRELSLDEFFQGPGQTVLAPNEVLLEVRLPPPPANSASHYLRFIPREEMDIAVAGVGGLLALEPGTRRCLQARIALAAVAPTPIRAGEAEAYLEGQMLEPQHLAQAGELAARATRPISDVRGSADYRRELVKVLTRRGLERCLESLGA